MEPRASQPVPPRCLRAHWQCQGRTRRWAPARPLSQTRKVLSARGSFLARCRALSPRPRCAEPALGGQTCTFPCPRRSARGRVRALNHCGPMSSPWSEEGPPETGRRKGKSEVTPRQPSSRCPSEIRSPKTNGLPRRPLLPSGTWPEKALSLCTPGDSRPAVSGAKPTAATWSDTQGGPSSAPPPATASLARHSLAGRGAPRRAPQPLPRRPGRGLWQRQEVRRWLAL